MSVTARTMTSALLLERHIPDQYRDDFEFLRNMAIKAAVAQDASREGEVDVFMCDPDESAGLAEVYQLDRHSRRATGVQR